MPFKSVRKIWFLSQGTIKIKESNIYNCYVILIKIYCMLFSELKRNVDTPIGKQILYIYLLKINHQATFYHFFIFETRFNSLNVFMLKHIFCLLFQLSKKNAILS